MNTISTTAVPSPVIATAYPGSVEAGDILRSVTFTTSSATNLKSFSPLISSEDAVRRLIEEFLQEHEPTVYKMTCQGCGAPIDQRIDDHILKCPYCKSVYAIGTKMIYSR